MKTILLLILSAFTASAATLYPVMSDNTNRTITGGTTNLATLNGTNTFTGPNSFTNIVQIGGGLRMTNTVANGIFFGLAGAAAPSAGGVGQKIQLYGASLGTVGASDYALGVESGYVWLNSGGGFKFYSGTNLLTLIDASGQLAIGPRTTTMYMPLTVSKNNATNTSQGIDFSGTVNAGGSDVYNNGRIYTKFDGNTYSDARLTIGTPTAEGVFTDVLSIKNGKAGIGTADPSTALHVVGTGLTVGTSGAAITSVLSATSTLNFDLTALVVEDKTITVTGAGEGDVVTLGIPNGSITSTIQFTGWVSATNTVTVRARTSVVGEDPASGTFRATVIRH